MCKPVMIDDQWFETTVALLSKHHVITLLGRQLRVEYCVPADRGGDFYILEAYGYHDKVKDVVSFTLDKNQKLWVRCVNECDDVRRAA